MSAVRALVVDDDPHICELVALLLGPIAETVDTRSNGAEGWNALQANAYDIVVLDWMMPGLEGDELCRRLRAMPGGDVPVVVAVTRRQGADPLRAMLDAGADDFLNKPLVPELLAIRLEIARRRVLDRRRRAHAETSLRTSEAELAETLRRVEHSHEDLNAILDELQSGTALIDDDGTLSFASRRLAEMLGVERAALIGRHWRDALPLDHADRDRLQRAMLDGGSARQIGPVRVVRADGSGAVLGIEVRDDPRSLQAQIVVVSDKTELHDLRRQLDERAHFHDLVGRSAPMQQVYRQIRDVARVDWTVLIEGETGSGKELVARAVHSESERRDGPFVAVNCAGLSTSLLQSQLFGHRKGAFTGATRDQAGFFEAANGGTLLLDEIGDIATETQLALLRVLESRELVRIGDSTPRAVDVRVLVATHRDLAEEVRAGRFRADLMYRIRVARVSLPPLRERRSDVPLLAQRFIDASRAASGKDVRRLSDDAMQALLDHPWPGNVRELRACIEFATIHARGSTIERTDLPPELRAGTTSVVPRAVIPAEDERERILRAISESGGNRSRAAKRLGISRATFYRRLTELDIRL